MVESLVTPGDQAFSDSEKAAIYRAIAGQIKEQLARASAKV